VILNDRFFSATRFSDRNLCSEISPSKIILNDDGSDLETTLFFGLFPVPYLASFYHIPFCIVLPEQFAIQLG